jgi:hypothetical protein
VTLEIVAILGTLIVHFIGAGVLVYALLDGEKIDWRSTLWPRDDDGGGGGNEDPPVDDGGPGDGGGFLSPLPLPDAAPSPVRLREPGRRIGDSHPRAPRRPEHAPTPAREPVPATPSR